MVRARKVEDLSYSVGLEGEKKDLVNFQIEINNLVSINRKG